MPQVVAGNIDLANRPRVKNSDGSISTVRSISISEDGKEVLIPTVSPDGRVLSDKDAIDLYRQTGQHLGKFPDEESATAFAQKLHESEASKLMPLQSGWTIGDVAKVTPVPPTAQTPAAGGWKIDAPIKTEKSQPHGLVDQAVSAIESFWKQVNPFEGASGAMRAAASPLKTAKGYGETQSDLYKQAATAFDKGEIGEGIRQSVNYFLNGIPGLGSTIDKAQRQGASGDVGGEIGTSLGLGLQASLPARGAMVGKMPSEASLKPPVPAAALTDTQAAAEIMPGGGPMRPKMAVIAQKVAPKLRDRDLIVKGDIHRTAANVDEAFSESAKSYEQAEASIPADRVMQADKVWDGLLKAKEALKIGDRIPEGNQAEAAALDSAMADLRAMGARGLSFDNWRTFRQSLDRTADAGNAYSNTPTGVTKQAAQGAATAARVVRDAMADTFQEMADANANYALLKSAKKVTDAAKLAKFLQETKFQKPELPPQTVMEVVGRLVKSTFSKTERVKMLGEIADQIDAGNVKALSNRLWTAGRMAGMTGTELAGLQQGKKD